MHDMQSYGLHGVKPGGNFLISRFMLRKRSLRMIVDQLDRLASVAKSNAAKPMLDHFC